MPTEEDVTRLVEAMDQILDDMGKGGKCVCLYAKAKARIAFEPFIDDPEIKEFIMSLEEAIDIVRETDRR